MSCHETTPQGESKDGGGIAVGHQPTVVLVGNPNSGKSTLFNALTGASAHESNAPGTTVHLQTGIWRNRGVRLIDLPGTYSLTARSPDEHVTAAAVTGTGAHCRPDLVVVVLDATSLARSLYLLAQVAHHGAAVVVALSMLDVARARGITTSASDLGHLLGVPVVPINPREASGLEALGATVEEALTNPPHLAIPQPQPGAPTDPIAVADRLFDWVDVTTAAIGTTPPVPTRSDRVDRVLLNPWCGVPVFLAVLWALFHLATTVATPLIDGVDGLINTTLAGWLRAVLPGPPWVEGFLIDGVLTGVGTVASFLPLMALIFAAIALLEDSGYLARAAFVADRAMRVIGLDGRAMLPLVIGFGCNLPALAATRTLPHARSRLLTGLLIPFTSCPARLTVYILLAGIFFPGNAGTVIFGMYLASVALVIGGGLILRATLFRDVVREPFVLVLPAYQRPRLRGIGASVAGRCRAFVKDAGTIIVATLAAMWLLMAIPASGQHDLADVPVAESAYGQVAQAVAPVFAPAGFGDWHMSAALASGLVAKEVVVGSFAQTYAVAEPDNAADAGRLGARIRTTFEESSGGHPGAAALAFMVFVLAYPPCLATVAEQRRLFGARRTAGAIIMQFTTAWLLAVVVFQMGRLL